MGGRSGAAGLGGNDCGSVGGAGRQEYTIMGDRVNLAARLMQRADGGILCDADTVARSMEQVLYSEPETLTVKGKSEPLEVRRPEGARERTQTEITDEGLLIGREAEIEMLGLSLGGLLEAGRSGLVYVEGEAGVGKSRLVEQFVATHARPLPVRILCGEADAIDRITPYRPGGALEIDEATRRSLELTRTIRGNNREGSLLAVLRPEMAFAHEEQPDLSGGDEA